MGHRYGSGRSIGWVRGVAIGVVVMSAVAVGVVAAPASGAAEPSDESSPEVVPGAESAAEGDVVVQVAPSITIVLDADPNNAQDFAFSGCNTNGCSAFSLDDDADPALPNSGGSEGLPTGTYTVTQSAVSGWHTAIFCSTTETVDLANRKVTIDLTAGEDVTCTFTNSQQSITLVEDSQPNAPQDFVLTGCSGACGAPFSLDDDSDPTLLNTVTGTGLAPGVYSVSQAAVSGWATEIFCTTGESINQGTRTATITLAPGEHVTCTFINRTQAITLIQDTRPNGPQDFSFTGCSGGGCGAPFSLDNDGDGALPSQVGAVAIPTGTYTVTQAATPGWPLFAITCTGGGTAVVDLPARSVTVTVGTNDTPMCTFKNEATPGPLTGVAEVDVGADSTCARLADGQARCWGETYFGAVGNGQTGTFALDVLRPEAVVGLTDAAGISSGDRHTCVVTTGNGARCWGRGNSGQLGFLIPFLSYGAPGTVVLDGSPLTGVTQVSAGGLHTCARMADTRAYCWGSNTSGQLGGAGTPFPGGPGPVSVRVPPNPLLGVAQIAAGQAHTCAVMLDATVACWGENGDGQLGNGTTSDTSTPTQVLDVDGVGALTDVAQVVAGLDTTCARLTTGQARCWGNNSGGGEIGDNGTVDRQLPVMVRNQAGTGPLVDVAHLSVGSQSCATLTTGQVRCWGGGSLLPVEIPNAAGNGPLTGVVATSTYLGHSCALLAVGEVRCWGANGVGQLGIGSVVPSTTTLPVTVLQPIPSD